MFSNLNMNIALANVIIPNIVLGIGMTSVIIPGTTLLFCNVGKQEITNASRIQNLIKNLGCAIGTSSVGFLVSSYSQIYQGYMEDKMTTLYTPFAERVSMMTAQFMSLCNDVATAGMMAQIMMYKQLVQQSVLCSYINAYKIYGIAILSIIPFTYILKKFVFVENEKK